MGEEVARAATTGGEACVSMGEEVARAATTGGEACVSVFSQTGWFMRYNDPISPSLYNFSKDGFDMFGASKLAPSGYCTCTQQNRNYVLDSELSVISWVSAVEGCQVGLHWLIMILDCI